MKKISKLSLAAFAAAALLGASANAAIVLSDNFNSENGGNYQLNDFTLTNWNVSAGSVDVIGAGSPWNYFPANGLFLDMNGSTNTAGQITSKIAFGPGTYQLTFDFAGSQRGLDGKISFSLGDAADGPVTLSSGTGFTAQSFELTTTLANSYLTFQSYNTGNGNIGGLLDNVMLRSVEVNQNEVPEPASLALLGAGLLGFGLMRRRKID